MRIVSLVPTATQILFRLGLGAQVVGVTHACDDPPEARTRPVVIQPGLDAGTLSAGAIDAAVSAAAAAGRSLYQPDLMLLRELRPDVLVTQSTCDVCAVSTSEVAAILAALADAPPRVITLHPHSVGDMLADVERIGAACGAAERGQAEAAALRERLAAVRTAVAGAPPERVACLEWLDPPFSAGHWVPEQVALAGGTEVLGAPGARSRRLTWAEVHAARAAVHVLLPCGYTLERTAAEGAGLGLPGPLYATYANRYFSGAGPHLVDGVAVLAAALHPERAGHLAPPGALLRLR